MNFEELLPVAPEVTAETDIVAVGGSISAQTVLRAYMLGLFPMDIDADIGGPELVGITAWFAPAQRAVLRYPGMHVSRSLRRAMRGFGISVDQDFSAVLAGCSDPTRPRGWINEAYQAAYLELHQAGFAHSVEVWHGGELAGGLLGVQVGGLFCADSKFHRVTDASKAALAGLCSYVFGAADGHERLIDAQWLTEHLASLGFQAMPRADYEALLPALLALPPVFPAPGRRNS